MIQDRMELSCSAASLLFRFPSFSPFLFSRVASIDPSSKTMVRGRGKKKELGQTKKTKGGRGADELFPGAIEGVEIYREIMSYAPLTLALLPRAGEKSSRRLLVFISLCHREEGRKEGRFADILMNSQENDEEKFFK